MVTRLGYKQCRGVSGSGGVFVKHIAFWRPFPRWHLKIDEHGAEGALYVALHLDKTQSPHTGKLDERVATHSTKNWRVRLELENILKALRYDTK